MGIPQFKEIHIENTNACGYKCVMCPRELQTRKLGYMSTENFSCILSRLEPFAGVVHLHGFGEPLLDRKLAEKIQLLKHHSPKAKTLIFSTLGVRVKEEVFKQIIDAGLDALVISMYGFTEEEYRNVHGFNGFHLARENMQKLSEHMSLSNGSFSAVVKIPATAISSSLPIHHSFEKKSFCDWAESLGFEIGQWTYLHNYSDGRQYNTPSKERLCPVIEGGRKEILNITWDLNVIPCCYDYNATIPFGNLKTQSLKEIFSSPEYLNFVLAHRMNSLEQYPICMNCEKSDSV